MDLRTRHRGLVAAVAAATAALLLQALPQGAAERVREAVAVLRSDGILLPFATFDGRRWSNRWPAQHATSVPIALADVPKAWWPDQVPVSRWTAWLTGGGSRPIAVTEPALVPVRCTRRVGLRSDFVSAEPPPPPTYQPYPKSGLATTGGLAVEAVEMLPFDSPPATALRGHVGESVSKAESSKVRAWSTWWKHPVDARAREKTPLVLELLARLPGREPGSSVYYFEGVKKYPGFFQYSNAADAAARGDVPTPEMCEYLTFTGGWLLTNAAGQAVKSSASAALSNCNREGLTYALPLGVIRTSGRVFWVVQSSSWDFEQYDIVEVESGGIEPVLSVGGGGCR